MGSLEFALWRIDSDIYPSMEGSGAVYLGVERTGARMQRSY